MTSKRDLISAIDALKAELELANDQLADHWRRANLKATADRAAKEHAKEQAKLKNIREGLIPVDDIRGLIRGVQRQYSDRQHPRTDIEIVASNPTKIEQAIIDALTAEKPNFSSGGLVSLSQSDRENLVRAANLYPEVRNSSFDNLGRVL